MNQVEEIEKMQRELLQLHIQIKEQHGKIVELQQKIFLLTGKRKPDTPHMMRKTQWSLENFIGLRVIHLIGIVVLVIGLSIGVKYAIDRNLISEVMRITLAYIAGGILYVLSVNLKKKYKLFSAILFSGSMASLYFTTFGAFIYYAMIPFAVAFAIMVGLVLFAIFQAIRYNYQEIALLGLIGAYAIPFLIGNNNDRIDLFFLYISLVNVGVVYLCLKRSSWNKTSYIAQALTWGIFLAWAGLAYHEGQQLLGTVGYEHFFSPLYVQCCI